MKILHIMIRVLDVEKSLDFYTGLMGLELVQEASIESIKATLYYLEDKESGVQIELTHNHVVPDKPYTNGDAFGHIAFEIDSMEEFTEKLNKFGLKYDREPFVIGSNGKKVAFVSDPDGNAVEIAEKGLLL